MITFPAADIESRTKACIDRYEREITYYRDAVKVNYWAYVILQAATIIFSATTPVLLLVSDIPKVVQALPAALAGIGAALGSAFSFREDYCRQHWTVNALQSERAQFSARSGPHYGVEKSDADVISAFGRRIAEIVDTETTDWRGNFLELKSKSV